MKKFIFALITVIFLPCLFTSCADGVQEKNQDEAVETLRSAAENINSKIRWTEQLEEGRLTSKLSVLGLGNKVKASPLAVSAVKTQEEDFIYPVLSGFASLNTTLIPVNLKNTLESFCSSFSKNDDISSFARKESLYNLALFCYDLKILYPEYQAFFAQDELKGDDKETASAEKSDENTEEKIFFTSYKIAEPFIDGTNYNVPLLFVNREKRLALETYWTIENSKWLLDQIQFLYLEDAAKKTESAQ